MKTAIIDGDVLVYEATTSSEHVVNWEQSGLGDLWTRHGFLTEAQEKFDGLLAGIMEKTGASEAVIALSSYGERWRNKVMPSYKQNRAATPKPLMYGPLREWVHKEYRTFERPTLEGDDVIGILMTHPTLVKGDKVCVSIDKDMKTIPGAFYNYQKLALTITPDHVADYWHMTQTLTGDATDGYKGCPGVGPVGAKKVLDPFIEYDEAEGGSIGFDTAKAWQAVLGAYKKEKLGEEIALMNARVARICRHTDYDFKKKEVLLWQPPQ